jgi:hypothetical protein
MLRGFCLGHSIPASSAPGKQRKVVQMRATNIDPAIAGQGIGGCQCCARIIKHRHTGRVRKFCSARCRQQYSRSRQKARFVTPARVASSCHETSKIPQQKQRPARAKIGVEGASIDAGLEASAIASRQNAKFWREALQKFDSEVEANGEFTDPGWQEVVSPDGVTCFVTRFRTEQIVADRPDLQIPDDLSIPAFLRRVEDK